MQKVSMYKEFTAREIHLIDGTVLENKHVMFLEGFVLVTENEYDTDPTWYNKDQINLLKGVSVYQPPKKEPPKEKKGETIGAVTWYG